MFFLEIYGCKLYETDILQSMLWRASRYSATEIGSSPKQFSKKIATLWKAIEFQSEGCDPSTMFFYIYIYIKYILTQMHTDTHTHTLAENQWTNMSNTGL